MKEVSDGGLYSSRESRRVALAITARTYHILELFKKELPIIEKRAVEDAQNIGLDIEVIKQEPFNDIYPESIVRYYYLYNYLKARPEPATAACVYHLCNIYDEAPDDST